MPLNKIGRNYTMATFFAVNFVLCTAAFATELRDVRGPPQRTGEYESRQIARVGQARKRLLCPVEDNLSNIVQWYKGDDLIDNFWTRYKISKESSLSLRIKDVEMEDAGLFMCKVANGFGRVQFNFTLVVVDQESGLVREGENVYPHSPDEDLTKEGERPFFTELDKMMNKQLHERPVGSSLRLRCNAAGNPMPDVRWIKDEQVLQISDDGVESKKHWTLKLRDLKESDSGNYQCFVSNKHGYINFTYTVEVIGKINTEARLIGPDPQNETVPIGGIATFQCKVKSKVKPHIRWLKRLDPNTVYSGNDSIFEVKEQKFLVLTTDDVHLQSGFFVNKLVIKNVRNSDAGMYICLGTNALGYSFRSAFLSILQDERTVSSVLLERQGSSSEETDSSTLPLIIAIPASIAIIVVGIAIFILIKRRQTCNNASNSLRTTRFNAVPTQERDSATVPPIHNNTHIVIPPKGPPSSGRSVDKLSSKNHSMDFYSDISSVSRCHHHPPPQHGNHQYGYCQSP
ncbi:fibroblast growth factor receptor-like 1 isoform X2 [Mya arenaria]|uniref:fibroblast growth factor receptor-like 1 isoform X2 n=1 Tax=Mya arenaria TaxID=6604 RepID=UPI0022E866F6|nr:fibroblast growth factor receptor-like 1 isoform X2 [Mya arenaria]